MRVTVVKIRLVRMVVLDRFLVSVLVDVEGRRGEPRMSMGVVTVVVPVAVHVGRRLVAVRVSMALRVGEIEGYSHQSGRPQLGAEHALPKPGPAHDEGSDGCGREEHLRAGRP